MVLCETYPGLAYAAALADKLPTGRIRNSKSDRKWRSDACDSLARAEWVRGNRVDLGNLNALGAKDDDFDAHFTAAAVPRCVLEGIGLAHADWTDAKAEGSMLLAGAVQLDRRSGVSIRSAGTSLSQMAGTAPGPDEAVQRAAAKRNRNSEYRCPIPGCETIFGGSCRGWDAHVGSLRLHPQWRPEVGSPKERRRLFRAEYRDWFE